MRLRLLAVGTRMPDWVERGFAEYAGRLPRECRLELVEIAPAPRGRNDSPEVSRRVEAERIDSRLRPGDHVVALDVAGRALSTEQLAGILEQWMAAGRDVALLVGGPDGLHDACVGRAAQRWSLSPLTLPHPLVRVIVAEQLYRASSILRGHPYHRGSA